MAVAGGGIPAQHIVRIDGRYWIMHSQYRLASVLADVEAATTLLRSGENVWIRSIDHARLEQEMGVKILSIHKRGTA